MKKVEFDLRIMACTVLQLEEPNQKEKKANQHIYLVLGTSSGEIQFHNINVEKRKI